MKMYWDWILQKADNKIYICKISKLFNSSYITLRIQKIAKQMRQLIMSYYLGLCSYQNQPFSGVFFALLGPI